MVEYVFHNIESQPILFLHDHYFYYSLEDIVSDRKGSKEAAMGLPKLYVVWCMLFPLGTDENDAVVCLKKKSTREFIHLKMYLLNIPPSSGISLVDYALAEYLVLLLNSYQQITRSKSNEIQIWMGIKSSLVGMRLTLSTRG